MTGGPAFPATVERGDGVTRSWTERTEGMSLRDYFAARFITAQFETCHPDALAKKAYEVADAMLKAREERR